MLVIVQGAMEEARALFRDKQRTEFIVVTIPTVMAMAESERLAASLEKEQVPCKRIVVNQLVRATINAMTRLLRARLVTRICAARLLRDCHSQLFEELRMVLTCRLMRELQTSSCRCGEQTSNVCWTACGLITLYNH
jgi:anion-transporting  ArsA/GET3 family ATPase